MKFFQLFLILSFSHGFCSDDIKEIALSVGGVLVSAVGFYGALKVIDARHKLDYLLNFYSLYGVMKDEVWGGGGQKEKEAKILCLHDLSFKYHNYQGQPSFLMNFTFGRELKNLYFDWERKGIIYWNNDHGKVINVNLISEDALDEIRNNMIKD